MTTATVETPEAVTNIKDAKFSDILENWDRSKLKPFKAVHDDGRMCAEGLMLYLGYTTEGLGLGCMISDYFDRPGADAVNLYSQPNDRGSYTKKWDKLSPEVQRQSIDEGVAAVVSYLRERGL